ncbi:MAG: hypothetical protein RLZZ50_1248 [Verrucomicrobiota bacterium]
MSSSLQRPDTVGRASRARLGAPASCLLVILAANQAAARDAPASLPYLAHAAPTGLRFAAALPQLQPPPRPANPAAAVAATPPAELPPPESGEAAVEKVDPATVATPAENRPAATPPEAVLPPSVLPDTYGRTPTVTVEDFLPFFLPSDRPRSSAGYEIK